jgi:predicted DNA-binding protein with PD1-like motif
MVGPCVGSLTNYNIRFANQPNGSSDCAGKTIGGHLMDGCTIYTRPKLCS